MQLIGHISSQVIGLLKLNIAPDTPIYIGQTNLDHMQKEHAADFFRYGADVASIIAYADYVGKNPLDGSIEYVKEYITNQEHVKVAVRISAHGRFYARSLYVLNPKRVKNFIEKGTLIQV